MAFDGSAPRVGRRLLSLIALAGLLCAPVVFAEPSSADKETARTLMREGDEKFAVRDYAGALKAYQAAHAIMQVPTTGLPLARAQVERGLLVEARDTLLQVSRYPKETGESPFFTKARDEATSLAQKLADKIPSIAVSVEGPPKGAAIDVAVDGIAVPVAALGTPWKTNPGQHEITASSVGFQALKKKVNLREGENDRITLKLVPSGASGAAAPSKGVAGGGRMHVVSPTEPGNVFIDGRAVGATPLDVPVAGGAHKIEVEYPGGTHEERTVNITAGTTLELSFQPSELDTVARHRKGVHLGIAGGPSLALFQDSDNGPLYGGTASFVFNVGINPLLDFRTGASIAILYRGSAGYKVTQLSVVVPAMLHIHYHPWFSVAAGLSAGFAANLGRDPEWGRLRGFSIGPEWSVLTMHAGDKRQFELSFAQGLRFGDMVPDYHQSLVFTYLRVD